jgi:hypothetical protein
MLYEIAKARHVLHKTPGVQSNNENYPSGKTKGKSML